MRAGALACASCLIALLLLPALAVPARAQGARWGTPEMIQSVDRSAFGPDIAVDPRGNAVAVWFENLDGWTYQVWANRYAVGAGWGSAQRIDTLGSDASRFPGSPHVAVDGSGNAVAVWMQNNSEHFTVWANRYAVGTGWGTARRIDRSGADRAWYPTVGADPAGDALAVWSQEGPGGRNLYADRFTIATGWADPEVIGEGAGAGITVGPSGDAVAFWTVYNGTYALWADRYDAATGWGAAGPVDASASYKYQIDVGLDSAGNAVAVWEQGQAGQYDIVSSRYLVGTGWLPGEVIGPGGTSPQVTVEPSGTAIAVWQHPPVGGSNWSFVWSSRYVPGGGWEAPGMIEDVSSGGVGAPQVGSDASGDAVAAWWQPVIDDPHHTRYVLYAERYVPGGGWRTPEVVESDLCTGPCASAWRLVAGAAGDVFVVWPQDEGSGPRVWANRYGGEAVPLTPLTLLAIAAAILVLVPVTASVVAVVLLRRKRRRVAGPGR